MTKTLFDILYRALKFMILALLVYGFVQTLPIDIAFLLAGDTLLYFEVVSAVWLAAQVTRVKLLLLYFRVIVAAPLRRHWRRARRAVRTARRRLLRPRNSDDDGGWGALVPA
jgi:uncharacterized membrane protein